VGRHKRSAEAVLRREARSMLKMRLRSLVLARSFRDRERSETVCLLSRVELLGLACSAGSAVQVCDVPDVEHGEILVDSRGQGSFQR
jgi:hypothetical protein